MHISPTPRTGTPAAAMPARLPKAVKGGGGLAGAEIPRGWSRSTGFGGGGGGGGGGLGVRFAGQPWVCFEEEDGLGGATTRYCEVRVRSGENLHNQLRQVSVTGVGEGYLEGELLNFGNG